MLLALIPNINPIYLFQKFNSQYFSSIDYNTYECPKYSSGIIKSQTSDSFLATGHTALYLISGNCVQKRVNFISQIYNNSFYIIKANIVVPIANNNYDPILSNILTIDQSVAISFMTNNLEHIQKK